MSWLAGAAIAAVVLGAHAPGDVFQQRFAAALADLVGRLESPGAAGPLAALLALQDKLPPGSLRPILQKIVGAPGTDPLVGAQAAFRLSLLEDDEGNAAVASERRRALGFLDDFWIVGPFDAQGRSGLERAYPPETGAPDPQSMQRFPGKERPVQWRRAGGAYRQGAVLVDALLEPASDAVAYLLSDVDARRAGFAVLRVGSPGPIKIWVNGRLVMTENVVREAAPDQNAAIVRLRAGKNRLLIKTVVAAGAWRVFVRWSDEAGHGLPLPLTPAVAKIAGKGGRTRDLGDLLRRRAEAAQPSSRAAAWLDLARYLVLVHPGDADAALAEAALDKSLAAGASNEALWLLGETAQQEHRRREAWVCLLGGVAASSGERAAAWKALGDLASAHHRDGVAVDNWNRALATDAAYWPAVLALASEQMAVGLGASALARIDALPEAVRGVLHVRRARIKALQGLGRYRESEALLRVMGAAAKTDVETLQALASAAKSRGGLKQASAYLYEAAALRPDLVFFALESARLAEGAGDAEGAAATLRETVPRLPDNARLAEDLGKILARLGRPAEAVVELRRALALRPQNPSLRRFTEHLALEMKPDGIARLAGVDLAKQYAADVPALARHFFASGGQVLSHEDSGAQASSIVLLNRRVVNVHGNGLSGTFVQRVVHVRTEEAAREAHEFPVRYVPTSQEVEIQHARLFRRGPGGEVEEREMAGRDDRDLSEPWYGTYYDHRAEVVLFEEVKPGDLLEVQYTVADVAPENAMAGYFGDFESIAEAAPVARWEYTLIGPKDRPFYFNVPKIKAIENTQESHGDATVYRFVARDVPAVDMEPSMPGFAEAAPYLHVSTYQDWREVGRWYWHLIEDQLLPDETVKELARKSTAGAATDAEKVRALYALVIEGTRYVALEFGIHGFKPYKVAQILNRRFGDCKDKASLLVALLREVGVDAQLVLLRSRGNGRIDPVPASLAVFDHAVVYVPRLDLYLDATAEFSGVSELPAQDQGVMVLRIGPGGAVFTETPLTPSQANRVTRTWAVDLDAHGAGVVREQLTITGQAAADWRRHYQTPGERRERYGRVWNGRFPGAVLESLQINGTHDRNQPVTLASTAHVPQLGTVAANGGWSFALGSKENDLVRSYASLSDRKQELLLAYPWQHQEDLVFQIPAGWRVAHVPEAKAQTTKFGRFEVRVVLSDDGRSIAVHSFMEIACFRVSPGDYPGFRAYLRAIDAALGGRVVLAKGVP